MRRLRRKAIGCAAAKRHCFETLAGSGDAPGRVSGATAPLPNSNSSSFSIIDPTFSVLWGGRDGKKWKHWGPPPSRVEPQCNDPHEIQDDPVASFRSQIPFRPFTVYSTEPPCCCWPGREAPALPSSSTSRPKVSHAQLLLSSCAQLISLPPSWSVLVLRGLGNSEQRSPSGNQSPYHELQDTDSFHSLACLSTS